MDKLIHISKIWAMMEEKDRRGKLKLFSFQYAKKNGELANYANATFSSIFSKGATLNIMLDGEVEPHTFRKICITRFNDFKVYI